MHSCEKTIKLYKLEKPVSLAKSMPVMQTNNNNINVG